MAAMSYHPVYTVPVVTGRQVFDQSRQGFALAGTCRLVVSSERAIACLAKERVRQGHEGAFDEGECRDPLGLLRVGQQSATVAKAGRVSLTLSRKVSFLKVDNSDSALGKQVGFFTAGRARLIASKPVGFYSASKAHSILSKQVSYLTVDKVKLVLSKLVDLSGADRAHLAPNRWPDFFVIDRVDSAIGSQAGLLTAIMDNFAASKSVDLIEAHNAHSAVGQSVDQFTADKANSALNRQHDFFKDYLVLDTEVATFTTAMGSSTEASTLVISTRAVANSSLLLKLAAPEAKLACLTLDLMFATATAHLYNLVNN